MALTIAQVRRPPEYSARERMKKCIEELAAEVDRQHDRRLTSRLVPLHFDPSWEKIITAIDCLVHVFQEKGQAFDFKSGGSKIAVPRLIAGAEFRVVLQCLVDVVIKRCADGPNLLHHRFGEVMHDYLSRYASVDIFGTATPVGVYDDPVKGRATKSRSSQRSLTVSQSKNLVSWWRRHKVLAELLRGIFQSVDRNVVSGQQNKWSLSALCASAFHRVIFTSVMDHCLMRVLQIVLDCRSTNVVRATAPLEEYTEMFKVASLCAVWEVNNADRKQYAAETPTLNQYCKIEHLVNPHTARTRQKFVVGRIIPLLPTQGIYAHMLPDTKGWHNGVDDERPSLHLAKFTRDPTKTPYVSTLEDPFLKQSAEYFREKSASWLANSTFPQYLKVRHHWVFCLLTAAFVTLSVCFVGWV